MSETSSRNLGVRLDPITTQRLLAMENSTGIDGVTVARESLKAAIDYFEATGHLIFPLRMLPKTAVTDDVLHRNSDQKPAGKAAVRVKVSSEEYALGKAKGAAAKPEKKPR